jgi:hypothetical protein
MSSQLIAALDKQFMVHREGLRRCTAATPFLIFLPIIAIRWVIAMAQTSSPLRLLQLHAIGTPDEQVVFKAMLRRTKCRPRIHDLWKLRSTLERAERSRATKAARAELAELAHHEMDIVSAA